MEDIRQAVERARTELEARGVPRTEPPTNRVVTESQIGRTRSLREVTLDSATLQSRRIVGHEGKDPRSLPFDILRTEVLRAMDIKGWKTVAVTSPTPGCGKTFLAINLALSMAREPERKVRLVDFDLRRPQIARTLDVSAKDGLIDVLEGRVHADDAMINVRVGSSSLQLMPTASGSNPSDLIGSSSTKQFLDSLSHHARSQISVIDLPPILTGHDAISILPHVDCVLLVTAVGTSKASEVEQCKKYLQSTDTVRVVVNKVPLAKTHGYYY